MRTRAPWAVAPFALGACESPTSALEPAGPYATDLAELFYWLTAITGVPALIYIVVALALTLRARARHGPPRAGAPPPAPQGGGMRWIAIAGGLLPLVIVAAALGVTLQYGARASGAADPAVTVDVIGHQFWWEVVYPGAGVVTANEIHVPSGVPVRLRLTSADVIHSFWVPRLQGKRDMTPGHVTELHLVAERPGVYRGQCYELCGVQHALMGFELVALPPAEFEAWIERQRAASAEPPDPLAERGREVFDEAACGHCHVIRGVTPPGAMGSPGPDLTHLASRRTLGGALLPNTRGWLAGWILRPDDHKPGVRMPPTTLAPADLHALLHYLEGLE